MADRDLIMRAALVGFNASCEGYNGECAFEHLEPPPRDRRLHPSEFDDPPGLRANLEAHLQAEGLLPED